MKMKKFNDKAPMPIIAIDFDDTISIGDDYPNCSVIRPWAKTVINFMHALGIKIVTCEHISSYHCTHTVRTALIY